MASTKRINTIGDRKQRSLNEQQIEHNLQQLKQRLSQYKRSNNGKEYGITIIEEDSAEPVTQDRRETDNYDFINPQHYVQGDGRQTWERMVDKWGLEATALWCEMTAFKYEDRIGKKPGESEEREFEKIAWYTDKAKELMNIVEENKNNSFFNK